MTRKPLRWIGGSRNDLRKFPEEARRNIGYALHFAQVGTKHPSAKPLKGYGGARMLEVIADAAGNTYRTVYTVQFAEAVYVLHAFEKKSNQESRRPRRKLILFEIALHVLRKNISVTSGRSTMRHKIRVHKSSGNVFADLGLPNAEDLSIAAELSRLIYVRIKSLGLTQVRAAARLGLQQPDISKLMNGRHTGFSAERLFRLLNALDQDIQIVVQKKPATARRSGNIRVIAA